MQSKNNKNIKSIKTIKSISHTKKKKINTTTGGFSNFTDPIFGYSPTDIYYNTEKRLEDSNVSIPTLDAVIKAKEWVDDVNKK